MRADARLLRSVRGGGSMIDLCEEMGKEMKEMKEIKAVAVG